MKGEGPKGDSMESKVKSVLLSYSCSGKRDVGYEVGYPCLIYFFASVCCFILLCFFGIRAQPLSPMTPQTLQ